jgi:putative 4-mercaptohistidine N1-methyltranferase
MVEDGASVYESDALVWQYLALHYGRQEDLLPYPAGPRDALDFPRRCVEELLDTNHLPPKARALDLGCAVGRSTFELARHCAEVIGIDFSARFIAAARALLQDGCIRGRLPEEGERAREVDFRVPRAEPRGRIEFQLGDACDLDPALGGFDVVLGANLIDRLPAPKALLARLPDLVRPSGQLILTSPFTWLEEFTPRPEWLGGYRGRDTATALREELDAAFAFRESRDIPFLIREHARKYQWSVAWAGVWVRR